MESKNGERLIKSIGYNQHSIIRDILDLHCDGKPIGLDITYSVGNFYGHFKVKDENGEIREFDIEEPKLKFDVDPQVDGVEKLDPWGDWPVEDNSQEVVMVDLPFVVGPRDCASMFNGRDGSNTIGKRFSSYYPRYEMFDSYEHHLRNAYRVLKDGGILIWKCQATVSGGVQLMTPYYSCRVAEDLGFYIKDEFILLAKQRLISGKVKKQQHARKYHSYFYVFEKGNNKRDKTGYWVRDYKRGVDRTPKISDTVTEEIDDEV